MAKEKVLGNNLNKASNLMERLLKNSTVKEISMLSDSQILQEESPVQTPVLMLNLALSGKLKGGMVPGHIISIAGESRSFKSSIGILMAAAFLKEDPANVVLFFDNEFGTRRAYFEAFDCDISRIIHIPFSNLEQLKKELCNHLFNNIKDGDKVMILCDSMGATASLKEVETSLSDKSTQDMTRSREMKGLYRIITPIIAMKKIIFVGINHIYKTLDFIPSMVMSSGSGALLASSVVMFMSKSKLKEDNEHRGYFFKLIMHKSRDIRDNVAIPLTVRFNGGIANYSGCAELAEQFGIIEKCREGKKLAYQYQKLDGEVIKVLEKDIDTDKELWDTIIKETDFEYRVENFYKICSVKTENDINENIIIEDESE